MILGLSKTQFNNDLKRRESEIAVIQNSSPNKEVFISALLEAFDNLNLSEYDRLVLEATLCQPKFDMLKIELALAANTSQMLNLGKIGLAKIFDDLQYEDTETSNLVHPNEYKFSNIFGSTWDAHSVYRAIVPFIFCLNPLEFRYEAVRVQDFQIFIYNACLDVAYRVKGLNQEYFNDSADVLVDKIMKCLYEDAIGSETRGIETFFNNFIKYMTTNKWYFDGAQVYDDFVTILEEFCIKVITEFETIFSHSYVRIAIYMRFKLFRYRINPNYDQEFYSVGYKEVK